MVLLVDRGKPRFARVSGGGLILGRVMGKGRGVIGSRGKSGQDLVASGQVIGATCCRERRMDANRADCGSGFFAATLYSRKSSKNNAPVPVLALILPVPRLPEQVGRLQSGKLRAKPPRNGF